MSFAKFLVAAIFCMTMTAVQAQTVNLRFATSVANVQEPSYKAITAFAARVKERSGGKINISIFPGEQLGAQKKVNEMIKGGATMINMTDYGQLGQFSPDMGLVAGPYMYASLDDAKRLFASDVFKEMSARLEAQGLKIIMVDGLFGYRHMLADRPIRNPGDMKGLTVRVPPSPIMLEAFKALGSRPMEIPWGEVYNALQSNVANAAEAPFGAIAGSKLQEVRKVISKTSHQIMFTAWITSVPFFNGLSPELQNILLDEGKRASEELTRETLAVDDDYANRLRKDGVQIIEDVDIPAFRSLTSPAYKSVPNLTPGILERIQAAMAKK